MEIASTGRVAGVKKGGNGGVECLGKWEMIVQKNSKVNGSYEYDYYFNLLQSYDSCIAEYIVIKTCLLKLAFVTDWKCLIELRSRGYKISTESVVELANSVTAGMKKVNNLITKAEMKRKEIERMMIVPNPLSFDMVMAQLSVDIAPTIVDDNITLARYNEFRRIIKKRNERNKETRSNLR